jgi:antitoxin ParD1/3/4
LAIEPAAGRLGLTKPVVGCDREVMTTATLDVSLPEALKEHVQRRVAEGAFSDASDFVRALIRLDQERQKRLAGLRHDIALGVGQLDRGEGLDGEKVFAALLDEDPNHSSRDAVA